MSEMREVQGRREEKEVEHEHDFYIITVRKGGEIHEIRRCACGAEERAQIVIK